MSQNMEWKRDTISRQDSSTTNNARASGGLAQFACNAVSRAMLPSLDSVDGWQQGGQIPFKWTKGIL